MISDKKIDNLEEYKIFEVVINDIYSSFQIQGITKKRNVIVLVDQTIRNDKLKDQNLGISGDLYESFIKSNNSSYKIQHKYFNIEQTIRFIEFPVFSSIVLDSGEVIQNLKQKYPGFLCLIRLSRVGFSRDMNNSILYAEYFHEDLFGAGKIYILKKDKEKWFLKDEIGLWIS
jgi:hypothetical protein